MCCPHGQFRGADYPYQHDCNLHVYMNAQFNTYYPISFKSFLKNTWLIYFVWSHLGKHITWYIPLVCLAGGQVGLLGFPAESSSEVFTLRILSCPTDDPFQTHLCFCVCYHSYPYLHYCNVVTFAYISFINHHRFICINVGRMAS